jgi:hypothetical protein
MHGLDDEEMHEEIRKEEFSANSESEFSDDSDMDERFLSGSKKVTTLMMKIM